ncbi:MAG TPA: biotin--[acetyl-CoA-carboxylase] ligase [Solirubrobacterales bacterium]|nr:biotin--[acetyl-CoA-carboxylase] ligase [Solirubrobacterales bacterium]
MREQSDIGSPHRHFARTDSTNTRARELAAAGAPHGTIVTASEQSAGRGRQGRTWTAPPGKALLYSAIVRPLEEHHTMLPLSVPLAVCETAEQLNPNLSCKVKWPNDIHVEGRKLSGILIEARPQDGWAVLGIGLNLFIEDHEFPSDLRDRATSLFTGDQRTQKRGSAGPSPQLSAGPPLLGPLTAAELLSEHLDHWIQADPDAVLEEWRQRDALRGREVAWDGGSGVADGVDDRGYLLVVTPDGDRIAVGAGEVHLTSF